MPCYSHVNFFQSFKYFYVLNTFKVLLAIYLNCSSRVLFRFANNLNISTPSLLKHFSEQGEVKYYFQLVISSWIMRLGYSFLYVAWSNCRNISCDIYALLIFPMKKYKNFSISLNSLKNMWSLWMRQKKWLITWLF